MSLKIPPRLISQVLIYESDPPLLVVPAGIQVLSQEDLLKHDWSPFIARPQETKNLQLLRIMKQTKAAFEAAQKLAQNPDLNHYHVHGISSAEEQFEENETTLSHLYRYPHSALRGLSYGEALCERLLSRLKASPRILEIGCGSGFLAKNFLNYLKLKRPELYQDVSYHMFDLSPALQASQKGNCSEHRDKIVFIQGDIQTYKFSEKFDLIISNEMIADLKVELASRVQDIIKHFELDSSSAPPEYLVNTGAMKLIESISEYLNPQGVAIVTEFGSWQDYPVAVKLAGHFEHSIRFQDLMKVAQKCGMHADLKTVAEFLNFDGDYEVLCRDSYALLSDLLLPYLGKKRLDRLPYDEKSLRQQLGEMVDQLINLRFYPLTAQKDLLNPYRFLALVLEKRNV